LATHLAEAKREHRKRAEPEQDGYRTLPASGELEATRIDKSHVVTPLLSDIIDQLYVMVMELMVITHCQLFNQICSIKG